MSLDVYLFIDVDTGGPVKRTIDIYEDNITHNLSDMAEAAGIYQCLWQPEKIGCRKAKSIIQRLERGLKRLKDDPEKYKKYNSPIGWGMYEHFVPFVENYLQACKENPKAWISVSR